MIEDTAEVDLRGEPDDDDEPTQTAGQAIRDALSSWVAVLLVAVVVAVGIRTYLFTSFWIPSPSMEPTLNVNDRLLVNRMAYTFHDIQRSDIVVFDVPKNVRALINKNYNQLVKRAIGLPGEHISVHCGVVSVNGRALEEDYVKYVPSGKNNPECSAPEMATDGRDLPDTVVPAGSVFVLGDNRGNSEDSRAIGAISIEEILGRFIIRYWPTDRITAL